MSHTIDNGARVPVEFPFFTGQGGLARAQGSAEATVAIRDTARGSGPGQGVVDGQPVEILGTRRSFAVTGITLVEVRFTDAAE